MTIDSAPNVASLVEQMPEPDKPQEASKFTGPDPKAAAEVYEQILQGGKQSLQELIALVRTADDPQFKDYKAEYVLHGLAIHVGQPGKEKSRGLFNEVLASALGNQKLAPSTRAVLVRELKCAGTRDAINALGKLLNEDPFCESAAQALVAIGHGASTTLLGAFAASKGKCRLAITHGLAVLRDPRAASALKKALADADADSELRITAAWGLAQLGEASSADLLLKAADAPPSFERIKLTQACLVLAENLAGSGKADPAARIYTHLRTTRTDKSEKYVRDLAEKALARLGRG